jgi:hypothetical protein
MEYEVEDTLHHRVVKVGKNRTKIEFFVKWLGEGFGACTYEPESHLENSPKILADYWPGTNFCPRRHAGWQR